MTLCDYVFVSCSKTIILYLTSLYCEIDGVAMAPLGPTQENAFLCQYEKEWLDSYPIEFKPKLYQRYVDAIFVVFGSRDHVKKFVYYMNTKHPNICFTSELEDQNSFSFLDIKIVRNTEKKLLKQYIGKVDSVVSLLIYKIKKYIMGLLFHCFSICSSPGDCQAQVLP